MDQLLNNIKDSKKIIIYKLKMISVNSQILQLLLFCLKLAPQQKQLIHNPQIKQLTSQLNYK